MTPLAKAMDRSLRHSFALALLGTSLIIGSSDFALAQYPEKLVTLVVGFGAGSSADVVARILAGGLESRLNQRFIIENRAGFNGAVASEYVKKAKPDGYVLRLQESGMSTQPALVKNLGYQLRDFDAISLLAKGGLFLAVHSSLPINSYRDLVFYAKSNPGKLNYISYGPGTNFLAFERLKLKEGLQIVEVPFKSSTDADAALMTDQVHLSYESLTPRAVLESGKLKVLFYGADKRSAAQPNVPIAAEVGAAGLEAYIWYGLMGPAGLPKEVISRLASAAATLPSDKELAQKVFSAAKLETIGSRPAEFQAFVESEIQRNLDLAKSIGFQPQ